MKKFMLFCVAALFSVHLFAQQFNLTETRWLASKFHHGSTKAQDTLYAPVFYTTLPCADTMAILTMGSFGYLTGNSQLATQCAQVFDHTGSGVVNGAVLILEVVTSSGSGTFTSKVFSVNTSNAPATELATSNTINITDLTVGPNIVPVTFATAPTVNGNFAVSVVFPTTAGDSIVIYSTQPGCVDSIKNNYAYYKSAMAGNWATYQSLLTLAGYGSIDLAIWAIVSSSADIESNPLNATLSIYPNPANAVVNFVCLDNIQNIKFFNNFGQLISYNSVNSFVYEMNIAGLEPGIYYAQITTDKGITTRKVTIY